MTREPLISINGVPLSTAQVMTVRVAIEAFAMDMAGGLGSDDTGKAIAAGYLQAIEGIRRAMFGGVESDG